MAYPASLDNLPADKTDGTDAGDDTPGSSLTGDHADHHNNLATAVNAIETELGTDPAGSYTDVKTRLGALAQVFNVKSPAYGAVGDGSNDDTAEIQAAIDAAESAGGGIVYFPKGTYLCHGLTIEGNDITLLGEGWDAILKQPTGTSDNTHLISCLGTGTTVSSNRTGVRILNLQLLGRSDTDTFTQYVHLIAVAGVSDFAVEGCLLKSWRGDAIYVGSFQSGGSAVERHNERVRIVGNKFDGNGKNNRNGVSIIDGTDVWVIDNHFTNCVASDMPGAVDIEPNNNTYHLLRGISITDNRFDNVGGNVGNVCMDVFPAMTTPPSAITIARNAFRNTTNSTSSILVRHRQTPTDTTAPHTVLIEGNRVAPAAISAIVIAGIRGALIVNNYLGTSGDELIIDSGWDYRVKDLMVKNNHFHRSGTSSDETGIAMASVNRVQIIGNLFDNVGRVSSLLNNSSSSSTDIDLFDNRENNAVVFSVCSKDASHTTTPSTNRARGNRLNNVLVPQTVFAGGDRTSVPTIASAATLTLTDVCEVFKVSGSTTITSITASWPGRRITLIYDTGATFDITDGSNLKMAGSATTLDADDCISFVCDGTNWHETGRSAN